ncbi:MAG: DUF4321 domain-containing protein [Megasphaera sp.]|jgi:hypothetical protein|nr:DUF4321 domain-containing protein [Megasphaera sp.]MCH4217122.1 DUF4321 domain-containing protein [Megasphaera sp.]
MKPFAAHGVLLCILFLVVGGILGGILGDVLSGASFGNVLPLVSQHYEIFNIQHVDLNLYVMEIQFGIRFAPNLLSIIGIFVALFIFRHV